MKYTSEEYIKKHPTLHEEDSAWKVQKIIPFVDLFLTENVKSGITLLDVGGGAGIILKEIAEYINSKGIAVKKYSLDLSSEMLEVQLKNNYETIILNEDIKSTSLKDNEIDLALMIDVLEHVPFPELALKELNRISKYVIFKVPLEDNFLYNHIRKDARKKSQDTFGHVNFYDYESLKTQIENNLGWIIFSNFTNSFQQVLDNPQAYNRMRLRGKLFNLSGFLLCSICPKLSSKLLPDFSMMLIKSYGEDNE